MSGFTDLDFRPDAVVHAAADVRHFGRFADSLRVNRDGARNVAEYCKATGAALHHVSTVSVAGEFLRDAPETFARFTERDLDIGQNWQDNVYVRSKLLGEQVVYDSGVPARVYRVGRLVGRASDGAFQPNAAGNSFFELICALRVLRAIPERLADMSVDLTPVDVCAEALVRLMDGPLPTCHLYNPNAPTMRELARALLGTVEILPDAQFEQRLTAHDLPVAREMWSRFRSHGINIHPDNAATRAALRLTGFRWPEPDVRKWLNAFRT